MKRKENIIIAIVIAAVLVLIVWFVIYLRNHTKKEFSWYESYIERSDQPYGTEVISELLEGYFEGYNFEVARNNIADYLSAPDSKHQIYVFIGHKPFLDDSTFLLLKDFVRKGNDAFFALKDIPERLSGEIFRENAIPHMDSVFYLTEFGDTVWYEQEGVGFDTTSFSYFTADKMRMNFVSDQFKADSSFGFTFMVEDKTHLYNWYYFVPEYAETLSTYDSLGTLYSGNFLNYIRIPYGKGNFYIHSNPIVFTNFFQIKKENIEYTSKIFSYLEPGDIIWDEASKTYDPGYDGFNNDFNNEQEGPLKYILSQRSLRWGWYVMITGILLFLLFRTKRLQQPIPVMETNENKSLEFIQTIGRMYYMSRNHKLIAQQKMKLFLHFINQRYGLSTKDLNDTFYDKLHLKSEISADNLKSIFSHYRFIEDTPDASADDLILFHQLLDSFNKNCK